MMKNRTLHKLIFVASLLATVGGLQAQPSKAVQGGAAQFPPFRTSALPVEIPSALTGQVLYEIILAEIAANRGMFDVTLPAYSDLLKRTRDPAVARRMIDLALYAGDTRLAREAVRFWQKIEPTSEEPRRVLERIAGGSKTQVANIEQKVQSLLTGAGDQLPAALLGLNAALERVGDAAQRRSLIERVTQPYLNQPEAHLARAQAQALANDKKAADQSLDAALLRRQNWEPAVLYKARLLSEDKPEAALQLLDAYLQNAPESRFAQLERVRAAVSARRGEEALNNLRALSEADPNDMDLRYAYAMLALEEGEFELARASLMKLLEQSPSKSNEAQFALGQLAEREGDFAEAERWFRGVRGENYRLQSASKVALAMAKQGKLAEAREFLASQPGEGEIRLRWRLAEAQLLKQVGEKEEAFQVAQGVLEEYPDESEVLYEYAMLAESANKMGEMEKAIRKLIAQQPEDAHARNALGYSLADRGVRLDEAEALIEEAVRLAPEDGFIVDSLGWLKFRQGKKQQALPLLERAYRMRQDPEIAAHLGEVLWSLGRQTEAEALWRKTLKAHPESESLRSALKRYVP